MFQRHAPSHLLAFLPHARARRRVEKVTHVQQSPRLIQRRARARARLTPITLSRSSRLRRRARARSRASTRRARRHPPPSRARSSASRARSNRPPSRAPRRRRRVAVDASIDRRRRAHRRPRRRRRRRPRRRARRSRASRGTTATGAASDRCAKGERKASDRCAKGERKATRKASERRSIDRRRSRASRGRSIAGLVFLTFDRECSRSCTRRDRAFGRPMLGAKPYGPPHRVAATGARASARRRDPPFRGARDGSVQSAFVRRRRDGRGDWFRSLERARAVAVTSSERRADAVSRRTRAHRLGFSTVDPDRVRGVRSRRRARTNGTRRVRRENDFHSRS